MKNIQKLKFAALNGLVSEGGSSHLLPSIKLDMQQNQMLSARSG